MSASEPQREAIDVAAVGRIFGVDPKTVARWDKQGRLLSDFRTPGGHRRYYRDRIEKLLRGES